MIGRSIEGRPSVATRRERRGVASVAVVVVVLCLASCSTGTRSDTAGGGGGANGGGTVPAADEGTPKDGGKLVFGVDAEPDGFDPQSSQLTTQGHLLASAVLEQVAVFDADKETQPYLAESIEPSNLALNWKIRLKPNITFHDGAPLDAEALRANLEASRKGIGAIGTKPIDSIVVVDDRTVEVKMNQPWAAFPATFLAGQAGYMISPATIGQPNAATHPVGTGPFMFDAWQRGTSLTTKKNPKYWQPGKPHLDAMEFRILTDSQSRANALEAGDVDMIATDHVQTINDYRDKPAYTEIVDDKGDVMNMVMNQSVPPFDNKNARKAVVLATDSSTVANQIGSGVLEPVDQPFRKGTPYYEPDPHYPKHDVGEAKKAAEQYKSETGRALEFSLTTFATGSNLQQAQILQQQWADAGIQASIKSIDQAETIKVLVAGDFQGVIAPNYGYPDPDFNFLFWHSSFTGPPGSISINFGHMKNDALDAQLNEGHVNLLPAARQAAYRKAVQLLNDDFAYVWLYRVTYGLIANKDVRGIRPVETLGLMTLTSKAWYPDLWLARR